MARDGDVSLLLLPLSSLHSVNGSLWRAEMAEIIEINVHLDEFASDADDPRR
jgi:hypothetical protein